MLPRLHVVGASGSGSTAFFLARVAAHWADLHRQSLHSVDWHHLHCLLPGFGVPAQASHGYPRPPATPRIPSKLRLSPSS